MSTVFLFGAGASFGSGSCSPEPPPLGNGENGLFNKLAKLDGVVTDIDLKKPELRKYFINNFEEGMESFDEERKGDIADFLREMAGFFLQFEPREDNLYVRLIDKKEA